MSRKVPVKRHKRRKPSGGKTTVRRHHRNIFGHRVFPLGYTQEADKKAMYRQMTQEKIRDHATWKSWPDFRDWAENENLHDEELLWRLWVEIQRQQYQPKQIAPRSTPEFDELRHNFKMELEEEAGKYSDWSRWPKFYRWAINENYDEKQAWGAWIQVHG